MSARWRSAVRPPESRVLRSRTSTRCGVRRSSPPSSGPPHSADHQLRGFDSGNSTLSFTLTTGSNGALSAILFGGQPRRNVSGGIEACRPRTIRGTAIKIAIIGAGNVGRTLGTAWRNRGHDIVFGVRNPDDPKYASLGLVTTNADAAGGAEIVVLCTPWQATRQAVQGCGDLSGKILIDCTNPLTPDFTELEVGHTTSGAEQIAQWAQGARVCKAMNQIGSPMMDSPDLPGTPVMFICGDDEDAKALTRTLVTELGFETVDAGDLSLARLLEPYALIWIHLALRRGIGTNFAFGLLRGEG
jgi:8-hydroxy-5-deazaflavin:NADPH oxidoreductase